jgi:hypothetical protein
LLRFIGLFDVHGTILGLAFVEGINDACKDWAGCHGDKEAFLARSRRFNPSLCRIVPIARKPCEINGDARLAAGDCHACHVFIRLDGLQSCDGKVLHAPLEFRVLSRGGGFCLDGGAPRLSASETHAGDAAVGAAQALVSMAHDPRYCRPSVSSLSFHFPFAFA